MSKKGDSFLEARKTNWKPKLLEDIIQCLGIEISVYQGVNLYYKSRFYRIYTALEKKLRTKHF